MNNLKNVDTSSYLDGTIIPFCRICRKAFLEVGCRAGRVEFQGNCDHTRKTTITYHVGDENED